MPNSDIDIHDHTLVWATHKDLAQAAVMPRSALHPAFTSGWSEVKLKDPTGNDKVQAALDAGASPPPTVPTVPVSELAHIAPAVVAGQEK